MSVSTTTDRVTYAGDNSTTAFSFPYVLFANGDLKVYLKNNTTGTETLRTITTHYTISGTLTNGVYESGVTVNFLTAPTSSETVLIYRDRSVTQDLELDENGKIPSLSLEKQLDKLTTDVQRVKNKLARSVALKEGYTASFNPDLPAIMVNEGYVRTKVDGSGLDYISQTDLINTVNTSASDFTPSRAIESDSSGLAVASAVTSVELGYLSGVTSSIQTQINSKQNTITGAASTIVTNDLTANRVVISNVNGKITTTNVTHNEVDRLSGVTDAVSGNNQSATLQNKTLDNTNIITVRDDRFTLQDSADTTKQAAFELSGIATGQTRTYTLPNASGTLALSGNAVTVQRFTSGSGTYTTPAGVTHIVVEMVGGGGGGAGSGTTGATNGTAGGNTTFGTSLLTANGGALGATTGGQSAGGTVTVNSPAIALISQQGSAGGGTMLNAANVQLAGPAGGSSFFGGAGRGQGNGAGGAAIANSGSGGSSGGTGNTASTYTGASGASGGFIKAIITSPSATYSYSVGAGGTNGAAGTSGFAGGSGASGIIVVTEYYI